MALHDVIIEHAATCPVHGGGDCNCDFQERFVAHLKATGETTSIASAEEIERLAKERLIFDTEHFNYLHHQLYLAADVLTINGKLIEASVQGDERGKKLAEHFVQARAAVIRAMMSLRAVQFDQPIPEGEVQP